MISYFVAFGLHMQNLLPVTEPEAILEVCQGSEVLELDGDDIKGKLTFIEGNLASILQ